MWTRDKTKKKGVGLLEIINCGKVDTWGKLTEDKGRVVRFV